MEDTRPAEVIEAVSLTKRAMALEQDRDLLNYNHRNALSEIEHELTKIYMRLGELRRTNGGVMAVSNDSPLY